MFNLSRALCLEISQGGAGKATCTPYASRRTNATVSIGVMAQPEVDPRRVSRVVRGSSVLLHLAKPDVRFVVVSEGRNGSP
jgi:ribosomal protein L1